MVVLETSNLADIAIPSSYFTHCQSDPMLLISDVHKRTLAALVCGILEPTVAYTGPVASSNYPSVNQFHKFKEKKQNETNEFKRS